MNHDEINVLSNKEKKVMAKTLIQLGWGSRKVEDWLGISDNTALRAVNEPTPVELKHFEAEFEIAIRAMKQEAVALAVRKIIKLIPITHRISEVVKAAEYLDGKSQNVSMVNTNVVPILGGASSMQVGFVEDSTVIESNEK